MRIRFVLMETAPGEPDSERLSIATKGDSHGQGDQDRAWEHFRTHCIVHGLDYDLWGNGTILLSAPAGRLTPDDVVAIKGHIHIAFRRTGLA